MFLYETHVGWKSLSFGQLPYDGREFGKGNPGFWTWLCFCLLSPEIYFSNESLFFFYCDGSNHEYPLGNKLCEGSLAKQVINIGHRPHFNILVWNRAAKKPRKRFQKRSIVLAISWNPEQQASCALSLPSSWAWAEDTSSVTLLDVQPPKWAKICKYYFFIGWERRQREHQDPSSISNAMSLRASQFSGNRSIQMEQGMREGKLESRLPDMNWSLMYEGAGLPNCYVSFQIYKSGHLLSTEF